MALLGVCMLHPCRAVGDCEELIVLVCCSLQPGLGRWSALEYACMPEPVTSLWLGWFVGVSCACRVVTRA